MSYYSGKVKVVGPDLMCFPADPKTLEPLACSTYDPWAITDPDPDAELTMSVGKWNSLRAELRDREMRDWYMKQAQEAG